MDNYTWKDTELQVSNLPAKAQQFISIMGLDVSGLNFILLEADPAGGYIKSFKGKTLDGAYDHPNIYLIGRIQVGTVIHELTHYYLDSNNHDTKAIGENYISQHGKTALSNYGVVNYLEGNWDEVVCEIVATYGRRGQFNKIKELFNLKS